MLESNVLAWEIGRGGQQMGWLEHQCLVLARIAAAAHHQVYLAEKWMPADEDGKAAFQRLIQQCHDATEAARGRLAEALAMERNDDRLRGVPCLLQRPAGAEHIMQAREMVIDVLAKWADES